MPRLASLLLSVSSLAVSCAAHAQNALDRSDPSHIEEDKTDLPRQLSGEVPLPSPAAPVEAVDQVSIDVGSIVIEGLRQLNNADFADIVQDHVGRSLGPADISALTEKLSARARERFPLATAHIAPQDVVGGMLRVDLDEGRIDRIALDGFENRHVAAILGTLVTGRSVTTAELERALLVARDAAGVAIRDATIRVENGRNVLVAKGHFERFRAQLTVDNDSTTPIGPFEALGYAQINGLAGHSDTLQAYTLLSLPQPDELGFARLRYARLVGKRGTEVFATGSYSRSRPGSYLAPLAIEGESHSATLGVSHPVARSAGSSLWLEGSLSYRELRQDRFGTPARLDRLSTARLRIFGIAKVLGGSLRTSATASQGLDILAGARDQGIARSRNDADDSFSTLVITAQWTRKLAGPWGIVAAVRTQLASAPLLVSEEIGLGGANFARGYDYSERSGDQGTMGYAELSYDHDRKVGPFDGLKPYLFVDGGKVSNLGRGTGGGNLMSAGGGIRFDVNRRTDAAFEIAAPLTDDRYETASKAPRIRVSLTRYF